MAIKREIKADRIFGKLNNNGFINAEGSTLEYITIRWLLMPTLKCCPINYLRVAKYGVDPRAKCITSNLTFMFIAIRIEVGPQHLFPEIRKTNTPNIT